MDENQRPRRTSRGLRGRPATRTTGPTARPRVTLTSRGGERVTLVESERRPASGGRGREPLEPGHRSASDRSDGLRLRRGLGNLGLTLLLPGSMQVRAGNERLGRWSIRLWLTFWGLVLAWVLLLLVARGTALAIVANPVIATIMSGWMIAGGIGWCLLMLDAWRISRPPTLARAHRPAFALVSLLLAGGLLTSATVSANAFHTQSDALGSIFSGGGESEQKAGRYNILLLGADAGTGRTGVRPDSMTVASVDAATGQAVLFSLPRNLEKVRFPADSPMKELYPDTFTCADHECLLNAVYTKTEEAVEEDPSLYRGVANPGARATQEAIEETLGLDINYYAMIDLAGFEQLIDSVGGIHVNIHKPVPVGGGSTQVGRYIGPGDNLHLNGRDALWFARSRSESSDYERMARQKCVMNAMVKQLDPVTVAANFTDIAAAGKQVVETDVPPQEVDKLLQVAQKTRHTQIQSVDFVPPLIEPGDPDFAMIRATVQEKLAETSEPTPAGSEQPAGGGQAPLTLPGEDPAAPEGELIDQQSGVQLPELPPAADPAVPAEEPSTPAPEEPSAPAPEEPPAPAGGDAADDAGPVCSV